LDKQPIGAEQGEELAEGFVVAQRLQCEVFVAARRAVAFVEAEADEVGNDGPLAVRRRVVEILPGLLDGGAPGGTIAVEVDPRAFQFDDGDGLPGLAGLEVAEDGIGFLSGDGVVLLELPLI
jgi:hypothetical protein